MEPALKKRISEIQRLPSCPRIIPEILRLTRDENSSMRDYEKVISRDPALTAQVLKVANSPFFGLSHKISNLRIALTVLGLQEIYRIVLNAGFYRTLFSVFNQLSYDFNVFWKHCQITANTAFVLAKQHVSGVAEEAYVCGLLHDVGKLIMEQFFPDEWKDVLLVYSTSRSDFILAEMEIFNTTHAEIGAYLLESWNLPEKVVLPVQYHHNPLMAPAEQELVGVVYFADVTATALMNHYSENVTQERVDKNDVWYQMVQQFPQMNLIDNPALLDEIRPQITREYPVYG